MHQTLTAEVTAILSPRVTWPSQRQKRASGVARHRLGERETIGSVATRALPKDSFEMEFLTDDPAAQAVTYQRVTFDPRAPRCGRYGWLLLGE